MLNRIGRLNPTTDMNRAFTAYYWQYAGLALLYPYRSV